MAGAEHATKVYGTGDTAVRALDDVTIGFPAARCSAIMGPSGSGNGEPELAALLLGIDAVNVWNRPNAATRQVAGQW